MIPLSSIGSDGIPVATRAFPSVHSIRFFALASASLVGLLSGKIIGSAIAQEIVKAWMTTDYLINEKKYTNRVEKVIEIAERHIRKDI